MSEPEILTTSPTKPHAVSNKLFKNKYTGEYSIRIKAANGRWRWVTTGTKDRLEALRRLERTGVGDVLDVANDARFKDRVVEILSAGKRVTVEQVVEAWIADAEMRLQHSSLSHHKVVAGQMLVLLRPYTDILDVTAARLNEWISTAPTLTMRRRRLSIVRDLCQFAFDEGYRKDNLGPRLVMQTADLTFDQMERAVKPHFYGDEVAKVIAHPDIEPFWKWAAQLGWWLGLRFVDVCHLQWGSICAKPGYLVVWQQKTRLRVELDLKDPVLGAGVLVTVFAQMKAAATDPVYCFPEAKQRYGSNRNNFAYEFRDRCKLTGMYGNKTFHSLRMGAAIRWKEAGRSLEEIGKLLGHAGTGNVSTYIDTSGNKQDSP